MADGAGTSLGLAFWLALAGFAVLREAGNIDMRAFDGPRSGELRFVGLSLFPSSQNQKASKQGYYGSQADDPPLGRRLAITVALFLGGLFIAFRDPDNGRSALGPDQYLGFGLCWLGLAVWLGTLAFPSTWGWLL